METLLPMSEYQMRWRYILSLLYRYHVILFISQSFSFFLSVISVALLRNFQPKYRQSHTYTDVRTNPLTPIPLSLGRAR
jgi:hypothetical protein